MILLVLCIDCVGGRLITALAQVASTSVQPSSGYASPTPSLLLGAPGLSSLGSDFSSGAGVGDLLVLAFPSVLPRAFVTARHNDVVHVESSRIHSHWELLCLNPQDWVRISTVSSSGPVCVFLHCVHSGCYWRFQSWLLQLWKAGCSSCGDPADGFHIWLLTE